MKGPDEERSCRPREVPGTSVAVKTTTRASSKARIAITHLLAHAVRAGDTPRKRGMLKSETSHRQVRRVSLLTGTPFTRFQSPS